MARKNVNEKKKKKNKKNKNKRKQKKKQTMRVFTEFVMGIVVRVDVPLCLSVCLSYWFCSERRNILTLLRCSSSKN